MFKHDDILIVGDSFAMHRDESSDWPKLLCNLLTDSELSPRGRGFAGASWWSSRRELIKEFAIKVPKVLVICHTESMRIPSDSDFGLNVSSVSNWKVVVPTEYKINYVPAVCEAARMYYNYLASSDYANWTQLAWYHELEQIINEYNVPRVIHLHCFSQQQGNTAMYCFKVGQTEQVALWDLCRDVDQSTARNHFTVEQNIKIAHAINNALIAYPQVSGWVNMNLSG